MTEKMKKLWKSLDRKIIVNQRELVLGVTTCALAGVLVGILLSPRKATAIGSFNGNQASDCGNGNSASCEDATSEEEGE